jgi:hypothetical protein
MTASFTTNAIVPPRGLDARSTADPNAPVAARLDAGLPVTVAERQGDWARVVCSNGWEAWVDGRLLVAPGSPAASGATAPAARTSTSGLAVAGIGLLSFLGAIAAALGGFLDWWSTGGISLTAWDIPMKYLVTGDVGDGVKAGPFLLVVVLVALPLATRRALPAAALYGIGLVPTLIAGVALIRGLRQDPSLDPRIGLVLTLAGGVLILAEGFGIGRGFGQSDR